MVEYELRSFDEALEGMNGNVSDKELDDFLEKSDKFAKFLGVRQDDLYILRDDGDITDAIWDLPLTRTGNPDSSNVLFSTSAYASLPHTLFISEKYNGRIYLYFPSEEDALNLIYITDDFQSRMFEDFGRSDDSLFPEGCERDFIMTPSYIAAFDACGLDNYDQISIENTILEMGINGDAIPGCGGALKLRIALKCDKQGKRGGLRVIYTGILFDTEHIFLLYVYSKKEHSDLTQKEQEMIYHTVKDIANSKRGKISKNGGSKHV